MALDASGYALTFVYMPGKIDLDVEAGGFGASWTLVRDTCSYGIKYPKTGSVGK